MIRVLLGSWYRDRLNRVREHENMKHRIIHLLQKYFLNPPIKVLFAIGLVPPGYALLETTGQRRESHAVLQWATDALANGFGSLPSTA